MKTWTPEEKRHVMRNFFSAHMEPTTIPLLIVRYAKEHNGKPVSERDIPKLQELTGRRWYIVKHYGWTSLQDHNYRFKVAGQVESYDFMIQRSEKNVVWDADWVALNNAGYLSARDERNHLRANAGRDEKYLEKLFDCVHKLSEYADLIVAEHENLKKLTEYGQPGQPDSYDLERMAGVCQGITNSDKVNGAKVVIPF